MNDDTLDREDYKHALKMVALHKAAARQAHESRAEAWRRLSELETSANRDAVVRIQEFLAQKFDPAFIKGKYRAEGARMVLDQINEYAEMVKRESAE